MNVKSATTLSWSFLAFLVVFFQAAANPLSPTTKALCQRHLADHVVGSRAIVPGAFFLNQALRHGSKFVQAEATASEVTLVSVSDLMIRVPLPWVEGLEVECTVNAGSPADPKKRIACRRAATAEEGKITDNARGFLEASTQMPVVAADWEAVGTEQTASAIYDFLTARGLNYGPFFRRLQGPVQRNGSTVTSALTLHPELRSLHDPIHPTLVDAALHSLAALLIDSPQLKPGSVAVPLRFGRTVWNPAVNASESGIYWVASTITAANQAREQLSYELTLFNDSREAILTIQQGTLQAVEVAKFLRPHP